MGKSGFTVVLQFVPWAGSKIILVFIRTVLAQVLAAGHSKLGDCRVFSITASGAPLPAAMALVSAGKKSFLLYRY